MTAAMTALGVILGTGAYMAPEQARGRVVDRRVDIWAFGCVLYEMLTTRRAFPGDDLTDVIAAVITREPDLTLLPETTPAYVRALLTRCFVKDPKLRLRDIGEARLQLTGAAPLAPSAPAVAAASRPWLVPVLALALVASVATVATLLWNRTAAAGGPSSYVSVTFAGGQPHPGRPIPSLAVSPNGRSFVYTASGPEGGGAQLWLRSLDGFESVPIPGTAGARGAFFSPRGDWIGYQRGDRVMKVATTFDPPEVVATMTGSLAGATWTDRDEIVFATSEPRALWRVPAASGDGVPDKVADGYLEWPDSLPGGTAVIVSTTSDMTTRSASGPAIARVDLATGKVTPLVDGGTYGRWAASGHLVFLRNNSLVATTYDPVTNKVGEMRVPVVDGLFMDPAISSGNYALSSAGTLVFFPGGADRFERTIAAIDPTRPTSPPISIVDRPRYYGPDFKVSPNGKRLAAVEFGWPDRIVVIDLERRYSFYLSPTAPNVSQGTPVWSNDNLQIAYRATDVTTGRTNIMRANVRDGGGPSEVILEDAGQAFLTGWAHDGLSVVADVDENVVLITPGATPVVTSLLEDAFGAAYSPDGLWLAVTSFRGGTSKIYVARADTPRDLKSVSNGNVTEPVWAPQGGRLYFVPAGGGGGGGGSGGGTRGEAGGQRIMAVDFGPGADPVPGPPFLVARASMVEPFSPIAPLRDGLVLTLARESTSTWWIGWSIWPWNVTPIGCRMRPHAWQASRS
jgi:Tol biopolymer transport system component